MDNPVKALNEWRRVVKPGGFISIYLSADPSLSLRIFRKFTTQIKAKRMGFNDYRIFIANEHQISVSSLIDNIKYVFQSDKVNFKYRPFYIRSWYLNLVCIVQIQISENNLNSRV